MDAVSRRVFFIGGESRFPSVRIRCMQIAEALGCAYSVDTRRPAIPEGKDLFVLVKYRGDLAPLRARGRIVWDVIDAPPPAESSGDAYVFSTRAARDVMVSELPAGALADVIPHHHCNVARQVTAATLADAVYFVGGIHWQPVIPDLAFETFDTTHISVEDLRAVYARAHILLNLRLETAAAAAHGQLASGIKLINAIGFGVPSVSVFEPAFAEIGPDCTVFASNATAAEHVRALQSSRDLYDQLRGYALARAEDFHLDTIASRYRSLCSELLARA